MHECTGEFKGGSGNSKFGRLDALGCDRHFIAEGDSLSIGRDTPANPDSMLDSVRFVAPQKRDMGP
jgi:hypothetical protein